MTTLITGGAGFIGSQLAKMLVAAGEGVVILDNMNSYYDVAIKRANIGPLLDRVTFIEGDIRDRVLVESIFAQQGITRVAHLAAMANVRYSRERGPLYADVNTNATVLLMDVARQHPVSVFVMASTSSVYGQAARVPFVEDDAADHPLAPYPASKRAAEVFGYSYHHMFGLNVTVLRFFNVYGPNGRPDMMPLQVIESILSGRTITRFDGGLLKRDWTYIDDIVYGVVAALERPLGYQVLNLGYGAPITLNEFIKIYEGLIGKAAVTTDVPVPATEPLITYCDNTRARQLLDFDPKVSIQEGLARTWAWYQAQYLDAR